MKRPLEDKTESTGKEFKNILTTITTKVEKTLAM